MRFGDPQGQPLHPLSMCEDCSTKPVTCQSPLGDINSSSTHTSASGFWTRFLPLRHQDTKVHNKPSFLYSFVFFCVFVLRIDDTPTRRFGGRLGDWPENLPIAQSPNLLIQRVGVSSILSPLTWPMRIFSILGGSRSGALRRGAQSAGLHSHAERGNETPSARLHSHAERGNETPSARLHSHAERGNETPVY
jgi:hypothetical protein